MTRFSLPPIRDLFDHAYVYVKQIYGGSRYSMMSELH